MFRHHLVFEICLSYFWPLRFQYCQYQCSIFNAIVFNVNWLTNVFASSCTRYWVPMDFFSIWIQSLNLYDFNTWKWKETLGGEASRREPSNCIQWNSHDLSLILPYQSIRLKLLMWNQAAGDGMFEMQTVSLPTCCCNSVSQFNPMLKTSKW